MSSKKDESIRNISNIKLSNECYIELKVISVRKQITLQEVVEDILEKSLSKKMKQQEGET